MINLTKNAIYVRMEEHHVKGVNPMAYLTQAQRAAIATFRAKFQTAKPADGTDQYEEKERPLTDEQRIRLRVLGQKWEMMFLEPHKAH
ncbi:MAG: hypothetical protein IKE01_02560 [Clostridia bacterium]|nr:hypothetical protein [Clostridia bacterium]